MLTAMRYAANYGYVPMTLADDDDPLNAEILDGIKPHQAAHLARNSRVECRAAPCRSLRAIRLAQRPREASAKRARFDWCQAPYARFAEHCPRRSPIRLGRSDPIAACSCRRR